MPKIVSHVGHKNAHRGTETKARPMCPRIFASFEEKGKEFHDSMFTGD